MPLPNTSQHFWKQFAGHLYEAWLRDPPHLHGLQWHLPSLHSSSLRTNHKNTCTLAALSKAFGEPERGSASKTTLLIQHYTLDIWVKAKNLVHAARGAENEVSYTRLRLPPLLNCLGCCLRAQLWYLPYCDLLPYIQRFIHESAEARVCTDKLLGPNKMALSNCCFITCKRR
ncbi:hypothetical protein IEQ34_020493 [Dendrobium chrysotoxum]|uniref:Uncharacterized protein n=1 Tax=Dendrobium chrysotoxum TaxID=161865 RepID=A0AAV7G0L9_DENCH|nr:hypothetical protein IEQ34_020493 [Dendrobium chrysotoxum]